MYEIEELITGLESMADEVPPELRVEYSEKVEELTTAAAEIREQGVISRVTAGRLIEEHGVEFGPRYPLISFTEHASPTNVEPALEGIISTVGDTLSKMWKAFIERLQKFAAWFKTKCSGLYRALVARVKGNGEFFKKSSIMEDHFNYQAALQDEEVAAYQKALAEQLTNGLSALEYDFVTKGSVYNEVAPLLAAIPAVMQQFRHLASQLTPSMDPYKASAILDQHEQAIATALKGDREALGRVKAAVYQHGGENAARVDLTSANVRELFKNSSTLHTMLAGHVVLIENVTARFDMTQLRVYAEHERNRHHDAAINGSSSASDIIRRLNALLADMHFIAMIGISLEGIDSRITDFWKVYERNTARIRKADATAREYREKAEKAAKP